MFINKKEKFSIRKFKDGRSDSVKIGTVGLIIGAALVMSAGTQTAEAAMTENRTTQQRFQMIRVQ